jgi:hypothetical protein
VHAHAAVISLLMNKYLTDVIHAGQLAARMAGILKDYARVGRHAVTAGARGEAGHNTRAVTLLFGLVMLTGSKPPTGFLVVTAVIASCTRAFGSRPAVQHTPGD